jgi:hypothetical protein
LIAKQWQPPKHWHDLEEMCELLYKAEFKPRQIYRYGRAGQSQHGVDIAACSRDGEWTGIQCKLKTDLLGSVLTKSELIDEHKKSRKFKPSLSKFYIATTCARDKQLQNLAATFSESLRGQHPVEILFWPDIERLLSDHAEVANRFYPEAFSPALSLNATSDGDLNITLQLSDWQNRLELFFRHASFITAAGTQLNALMTITSELVDNALNPGKGGAARVIVLLSGPVLVVRDDGRPFDSVNDTTELQPEMRGLRAIRRLLAAAGSDLIHGYTPADPATTRFNVNEFEIRASKTGPRDPCSASGPVNYLMNRAGAFQFVDQLKIPRECSIFTLRLLGAEYFNHSATAELIGQLLKRLGGRKLHIRISYDCVALIDALRREADSNPDVFIEQV